MKKTHVNSNVDLNTLAGGAFAEKVNEALVQVGENIQNQNTEATKKRKITITMTFAPNKTRLLVNTQIGVTTTLAATEAVDTQMVMGMNMRTGQLEIGEYDGQIRGQMSINEILEEGKKAGEEIMETADKMIAAQQATGDAEVAAGEPLDLRKRGQMSINEILEEGKKAGEEIMETADKMIAAQQATGDAEVAAGEPLDLRKRGQQSPEAETPEEKPEPDFDPETGEIFENGKGGKVIAMAKQA